MTPPVKQSQLEAGVAAAIRRHGEETFPHECCGALIGTGDRVTAAVALPNTTEEGPRRRFLVRPSDYRMAEQRASELGGELLGFYHSHPDHPARPSWCSIPDHAWLTFAYWDRLGFRGWRRARHDGVVPERRPIQF